MISVLIAFSIIVSVRTTIGFDRLTDIIVKLLIGLAVIYLFSEKKFLAGYIVLFIGLFIKYLYDFISFILSFQFSQYYFLKTDRDFFFSGYRLNVNFSYREKMIFGYRRSTY